MSDKKQKEGIKGVWIPGEVAFNKDLTKTDMFIWWMINQLDCTEKNCFASNEYIGNKLDINSQTVSNSISKLKKLEYIKQISFDGRKRRLARNDDFLKKYRYLVNEYNNDRVSQSLLAAYNDPYSLNKSNLIVDKYKNINNSLNNNISKEIRPNGLKRKSKTEFINNKLLVHNRKTKLILMHWNNLGKPLLNHPKENYENKTGQRIIKHLSNALNEGYDIDTIKEVITIYHKFLSVNGIDDNINGIRIGLDQLFKFNSYTRKKIKDNPKHLLKGVNSWFSECSNGYSVKECVDYLVCKYGQKLKDNYQTTTNTFKKTFIKEIIEPNRHSFKRNTEVKFSIDDENNFIKASKMFHKYLKENSKKLILNESEKNKPNFLIKFIFLNYNENNRVKPYWLISKNLWKKNGDFDKILIQRGYMKEN